MDSPFKMSSDNIHGVRLSLAAQKRRDSGFMLKIGMVKFTE
jgi:hypothetical protein